MATGNSEAFTHTRTHLTRIASGWKSQKPVHILCQSASWRLGSLADRKPAVRFYNVIDPYNMEDSPEPECQPPTPAIGVQETEEQSAESYFPIPFEEAPGLEALSAAAVNSLQYARTLTVPFHGDINSPPLSSNNINFILNPTQSERPVSV
jgi:hypothetical protein